MTGHRRVKDIDYDKDDIYSDEEEDYGQTGGELTAEDKENFATLTPVIRAELQEAGIQASDREIEDTLWDYFWDVGKSVVHLKNAKQPKQPALKQAQQPKKEKAKSKFDQAAERSAEKAGGPIKATKQTTNGLEKKTQNLNINSTSTSTPAPAAPSQPKTKSKGLNIPKMWSEQKSEYKPSTAFVVIGHVDHGKSTLMGRLLLDAGAVEQRDIDKYKKQATEMGKASFALAWVMDTGSEERERGVTVEVAQHHFSTDKVDFTILDAPGHRDFVPNMIGGASMADLAVLVVDANQLESGLKGQTREHIQLARAVGLSKVIVAVNKMDSTNPPWNEEAFRSVSGEVMKLLGDVGFAQEDVQLVPCSGLNGENVVKAPSSDSAAGWVANGSTTLIAALEKFSTKVASDEAVSKPLRMQVADVFRGGIQNPLSISGRITAGHVQVGDNIVIQPSGDQPVVKGIELADESKDWAVADSIPVLHLEGDIETLTRNLRAGDLLCTASDPAKVGTSFFAKVSAIDMLLPQGVDVHFGRLHVPGTIKQLVETLDKNGEALKRKPRVVKAGQAANIRIALENGAPIDVGMKVVLRSGGATVAEGFVERIDSAA